MAHSESDTATETSIEDLPIDHRDDGKPLLSEAWEGVAIWTSWGYGQTNTNLAMIVEVSDSGRTVLARMVKSARTDAIRGCEQVVPTEATYGDEFRLRVQNSGDSVAFRGSYPYINGDMEEGKRLDTFLPWEGQSLVQTPTNHGH